MPKPKFSPRKLAALFIFALLSAVFAIFGCNNAGTKGPGSVFTIGVENYPPYVVKNPDGSFSGYSVAVAAEVARHRGWDLRVKELNWKKDSMTLGRGSVDCLLSGLTPSQRRSSEYACTGSYLSSASVVVVKANSGISDVQDLKNKTFLMQSSTGLFDDFEDGKLSDLKHMFSKIEYADDFDDMIVKFDAGGIDGFAVNFWAARELCRHRPDLKILPTPLNDDMIVAVFDKHDEQLCAQFQESLRQLEDDGILKRLRTQYLGSTGIEEMGLRESVVFKNALAMAAQKHSINEVLCIGEKDHEEACVRAFGNLESKLRRLKVFANVHRAFVPCSNGSCFNGLELNQKQLEDILDGHNFDLAVVYTHGGYKRLADKHLNFHGIPVLCVSLDTSRADEPVNGIAGLYMPVMENRHFEFIEEVIPDCPQILVVYGNSCSNGDDVTALKRTLPENILKKTSFISSLHVPLDKAIRMIQALPPRSAVIVIGWGNFWEGGVYKLLYGTRAAVSYSEILMMGRSSTASIPYGLDIAVLDECDKSAAAAVDSVLKRSQRPENFSQRCVFKTIIRKSSLSKMQMSSRKLPGWVHVVNDKPSLLSAYVKPVFYGSLAMFAIAAAALAYVFIQNRSNIKFGAVLNNLTVPVWLYSAAGELILTNNAADALPAEPDGDGFDLKEVRQSEKSCEKDTAAGDEEYYLSIRPVRVNSHIHYYLKSAVDVTERNRLTRDQQFINYQLEHLFKSQDIEADLGKTLEEINLHFRAAFSSIIKLVRTEEETYCIYHKLESSASEGDLLNPDGDKFICGKNEPWLDMLEHNQSIFLDNLSENAGQQEICGCFMPALLSRNIASLMAAPVFINEELYGAFCVFADHESYGSSISAQEREMFIDISRLISSALSRRAAAVALDKANEAAQESLRAKSAFLSSISHELRTPLNAVIGMAEILKRSDESMEKEQQREYMQTIVSAGNTLLSLINDVLDFSKLESSRMNLNLEPVDVGVLCSELAKMFQVTLRGKDVKVSAEIQKMPVL